VASFPLAHDPTRRIINVHWRSGETPPLILGARIHNLHAIGGGVTPVTIFPQDGRQDLPNSQVSITQPFPPGETPVQQISGTISGAPAPQNAPIGYNTIGDIIIDGDLTLDVVVTGPGPNVTLSFDCSGYIFTEDGTLPQVFVANHLYIDTESATSAISLAMGPT
jgi:hypothetical protein